MASQRQRTAAISARRDSSPTVRTGLALLGLALSAGCGRTPLLDRALPGTAPRRDSGGEDTNGGDGSVSGGVCPGAPLAPAPPGPLSSSFAPCDACEIGEYCDRNSLTADGLCHRICADGACASGEDCAQVLEWIEYDTGPEAWDLCLCAVPPCAPLGGAGRPILPRGGIDLWTEEQPLPVAVFAHAAAATADRLFISGGWAGDEATRRMSVKAVPKAFAAPLRSDGRVGDWQEVGQLPWPVAVHAMAVVGDRLYVAGGHISVDLSSTEYNAEVRSARIGGDGRLAAWEDEPPLPQARSYHTLLADGPRLFVVGGFLDPLSVPYNPTGAHGLWLADLDGAGRITGWSTVRLPFAPWGAEQAVRSGRLYALDHEGNLRSIATPAITGGDWRLEETPLGTATPTGATIADIAGSQLASFCDALLLVLHDGLTLTAPLDDAGVVGAWRPASRFAGRQDSFAAATSANGHVYVTGGTASAYPLEDVGPVWSTSRP